MCRWRHDFAADARRLATLAARQRTVAAVPRRPRNELPPDGIYHVTVRGVDRCVIVRDESDWAALHAPVLAAQGQKFGSAYDAYCLMSSHFHLLVRAAVGAAFGRDALAQ